MDDLVKRLASWGTAAGLGTHFLGTKSAREDCAEAAAALAEARATIARLEALIAQESEFLAIVQAKKDEYMMALASIRDNTCCEGCQEAARVARAALSAKTPTKARSE